MEYLHRKEVIHGDLRGVRSVPQHQRSQLILNVQANVLISRDGTPRLSDFGMSKFLEDVSGKHTRGPSCPDVFFLSLVWEGDDFLSDDQSKMGRLRTFTYRWHYIDLLGRLVIRHGGSRSFVRRAAIQPHPRRRRCAA